MKLMHVNAKSNIDVHIPVDLLKLLPKKKWGVVTTIQHMHKIGDIISQLKDAKVAGQVLGCNASEAEKINDQVDAWLFVGSGEFHPVQVALKTKKLVWLWNPTAQKLGELPKERVESWQKRKDGQVSKFIMAKTVGIIVSTKMGQKNLARAKELMQNKDKEWFLFACDEMNTGEFENFNFIDFWVNTACPRIPDQSVNMVNIDDLIDAGLFNLKKDKSAYEAPIWMSDMGLKK